MELESRSLLYDIRQSLGRIERFVGSATLEDFERDDMMRSAVERQFEIIGEAVNRLSRQNSALTSQISDATRIIGFRNQLIHGYFTVDHRIVWDVIQSNLPTLRRQVDALLQEE